MIPDTESVKLEVADVIEAKFAALVEKGEIVVEEGKYIIARFTHDKEEAINFVERFARTHNFDRLMTFSFTNGMAEGIATARKQIVKMGALHGKAASVCDRLLQIIQRERDKL